MEWGGFCGSFMIVVGFLVRWDKVGEIGENGEEKSLVLAKINFGKGGNGPCSCSCPTVVCLESLWSEVILLACLLVKLVIVHAMTSGPGPLSLLSCESTVPIHFSWLLSKRKPITMS